MSETFLQTDIVGSTRLWLGQPEAMRQDLELHDALLREAVEQSGGRLFKHTGDGLLAHFNQLDSAFLAARTIQRVVAEAHWKVDGGLSVRVAVFTGDAVARGGDFFGPALNALARLIDLPCGGQSLFASAEPLESDGLRPLGRAHLSEGVGVWHVHQILRAGEPDFPPLRVSNLPPRQASFIGRASELARIGEAAQAGHVVTLVGPGGCGKTQLALEWLGRTPTEVVWVPLAKLEPGADIASEVWRALSNGAPEPVDLLRTLRQQVSTREVWLALDNAEHVLESTAELVAEFAGVTRFLITSREPLGVLGEQVVRVGPMALEEGVQLFLARAISATGHGIETDQRAQVERLVRRLEGFPLALELAASRLRSLSLADLEARLEDRFQTLTSNQRGRPARHLTLERTLDWSFELLSPSERELLMAVGLIPSPFQLEMLAGWWPDDGLEEDLGSLVDKSWVVLEPKASPYRVLETIRDYARIKRAEAENESTFSALHAAWALSEARRLKPLLAGADAETATDQIERLVPQFKFATRTFLARSMASEASELLRLLWRHGYRRGRVRETLRELRPLWERIPPQVINAETLDARRSFGWALYLSGMIEEAKAPAREALNGALAIGSAYDESQARNLLAGVLSAEGDHGAALHEYWQALGGLEGDTYELARARIKTNIGATALLVGAYEEALRVLEEAESVMRHADDLWATAWILLSEAQALRCLGRLEEALPRLEESLEIRTRLGDERGVAYAHLGLSQWHLANAQPAEARTHLLEGAQRALKIEDPWAIDAALLVCARWLIAEQGASSPASLDVLAFLSQASGGSRFARTAEDKEFLARHAGSPAVTPSETAESHLQRHLAEITSAQS